MKTEFLMRGTHDMIMFNIYFCRTYHMSHMVFERYQAEHIFALNRARSSAKLFSNNRYRVLWVLIIDIKDRAVLLNFPSKTVS